MTHCFRALCLTVSFELESLMRATVVSHVCLTGPVTALCWNVVRTTAKTFNNMQLSWAEYFQWVNPDRNVWKNHQLSMRLPTKVKTTYYNDSNSSIYALAINAVWKVAVKAICKDLFTHVKHLLAVHHSWCCKEWCPWRIWVMPLTYMSDALDVYEWCPSCTQQTRPT